MNFNRIHLPDPVRGPRTVWSFKGDLTVSVHKKLLVGGEGIETSAEYFIIDETALQT